MNNGRDLTPVRNRKQRSTTCRIRRGRRKGRRLHVVYKASCESTGIDIKARGSPNENPATTLAGAAIGDLDTFTRRELALPNEVQGIVVDHVAETSLAHKAGLRRGHIITEINCTSVLNVEHALMVAEAWKDGRILLEVWTEKGRRHLTIYKP